MAITLSPDRQTILVAYKTVNYDDITASGTAEAFMDVPSGAQVVGGDITVVTAWNSATSDVVIIGDGDDDNRYYASASIASTGRNPLIVTGYQYSAADTIDLTWTGVGAAPTAGSMRLSVWYVIEGRGNEVQG